MRVRSVVTSAILASLAPVPASAATRESAPDGNAERPVHASVVDGLLAGQVLPVVQQDVLEVSGDRLICAG